MKKITIGARGSKLSLAYVAKVKELLIKNNNNLKEENINLFLDCGPTLLVLVRLYFCLILNFMM